MFIRSHFGGSNNRKHEGERRQMQFSIKLAYVTFCQRKWIRKLFGLPFTNKNCERGYNHPNDKHDEIKKCEFIFIFKRKLFPPKLSLTFF